ncbi:conserved hypothetical protein [Gluconacetobacter diazotrophicus PA1 5]|uniref:hypothetical protein n=1 Tax=Gluconacetobacter diazotrophicus TaxID=33996 RepID=UPI000173DA5E|nr:hypothetical protein [Gluconacetobacter diazotrophicus]ACI52206.1 conserved hypothetical protein [Gluconacetobacter diazotrophicus PA1 5]TWB00435.1 hypothetical protein FBZ86_13615 [Gluconacetobacter diazotrophicus]
MSRIPLNESAQRRASAVAENHMAAGPVRQRPGGRKPFGTHEQKLAYPNRDGYHRHWFNDEPGRIARAQEAGYTQVMDDSGKPVSMTVGVTRGGGPQIAYLMEIPEEWYREDMAAQDAEHRVIMDQIRNGQVPGGPTGADRSAQYVPVATGIKISEERR